MPLVEGKQYPKQVTMVELQLFQIIRHFIKNEPLTFELDWPDVWSLAKKHGLGQFVSAYMNRLPAEQRPEARLQSSINKYNALMVSRQINQDVAVRDIHSVLEEKECYHLFIKGVVTKHRYGDPFFRSMGDIDFLYQETQHSLVKSALLDNGFSGYREGRKNDTYYREPYVCVEAHRQLVPSESSYFQYCSYVWERALPTKGSVYQFEMSIEDELIFNIIHLAIHFLEGGAGIRFILDVYIYNHLEINHKYVEKELLKLDLFEFYKNISSLAEEWFGQGKKTVISEKLASFILKNGTFGSANNASALAVREGRWNYLKRMCFPSNKEMISRYPWLKNKKILLPFAWMLRGFRVLIYKRGSLHAQMRKTMHGNMNLGQDLHKFYQECGLRSSL